MALRDWIALGVLVALALVGLWAILRWRSNNQARAENAAAAKRTEAELDGVRAGVIDIEKARKDQEAWERFKENFGE